MEFVAQGETPVAEAPHPQTFPGAFPSNSLLAGVGTGCDADRSERDLVHESDSARMAFVSSPQCSRRTLGRVASCRHLVDSASRDLSPVSSKTSRVARVAHRIRGNR